jgi:transposase
MKIQDVFQKANQKYLTWKEASEILGVDERTIRRWKNTIELNGYEGLLDKRTKSPSPLRAPERTRDQVKKLYRDTYFGWNVKHFHEQLAKHNIPYKYSWTKNLLQEASLVDSTHKRKKHRKKRDRKPLIAMMLHIDGSEHVWIPHLAPLKQVLIVIMDDANNDIYYAKLVNAEDTRECMHAFKHVIATYGLFCSIYSDRAGHFFHTPKAGGKVNLDNLTQVGQALFELGIQMIPAYSPEARGRSERLFGTWQNRLPKELKLHNIKTIPDANRYILEVFLPWYKNNLVKTPPQKGSAFTPYRGKNLDLIFSIKEQRTVNCDNTVQWNNRFLQIQPSNFRISFAKCKVLVHEHLDGNISVVYGPHVIGRFDSQGNALKGKINHSRPEKSYPHIHINSQRKRKKEPKKEKERTATANAA